MFNEYILNLKHFVSTISRMFGGSSRRDGSGGSPPTFGGGGPMADMKIGTWDDGSTSTANGSRSNNAFPPVGNFEIGTFSTTATSSANRNGNASGGVGDFNAPAGTTGGNVFNQSSHTNLQGGGLGIRETGIIEKLLVSICLFPSLSEEAIFP